MDGEKSTSGEGAQKPETLWSNEHFIQHNEQLQIFFENQQFCDVTLVSSDEKYEVKAHRLLLASVSKYFLKMFGEKRFTESKSKQVKMSLIDGHSLKSILNFIYKGIVELTADTVESILEGSHILELSPLEKLCCDYMKKNIDVSNCLGVSDFANRHNLDDLNEAAMLCACKNFADLKDEDEFKSQDVEQLCALISMDDLRASSEADVFHCILAWIEYDKDERKQFLERLLNCVRYPLLSTNFIGGIVEKVGESIETLRIVCKAYAWHASPSWRSLIFPRELCKIRNFKDVIVAISGCKKTDRSLSVGLYYSGLKEWIYTKWPRIPHARDDLKFTVFNKKLIIVGGIVQNNRYSNRVDCLNLDTLEWSQYPNLAFSDQYVKTTIFGLNGALWCSASGTFCINKLEKPFEKWQQIDVARRSGPQANSGFAFVSNNVRDLSQILASNVFATHNDKIYFPEQCFYSTYNVTDNTFKTNEVVRQPPNFSFAAIPRPESQMTLGPVVGVHIVRNLGLDFLVEIAQGFAFVYDLETKTRVVHNISFDASCTRTALHGKNIIIYGPERIYEYDVFSNKLHCLPPLNNNREQFNILLTNSDKEEV